MNARSGYELDVGGADLTFLRIDHQIRLQFGETEVVIESPFVLKLHGVDLELDPAERSGLGPLLGLYPDALASATIDVDATLRLTFTGGAEIVVPPDPSYEAWQVNGPGTNLVVCLPGTGGDLAIWS